MSNRRLKSWVIPVAIVLVTIIIVGIAFGISKILKNQENPTIDDPQTTPSDTESSSGKETEKTSDDTTKSTEEPIDVPTKFTEEPIDVPTKFTIRGYVNTFGGYTSLFAANGGNTTTPDSSFGKAGLNLEINIEDNDDNIIDAFIEGKIDFFAMTVNKMAVITKQLEDKGVRPVMPIFLDTSTGGDGIIADKNVKNIRDLQNVKIAMARNSVSTAIPVWFLNNSGLSEAEVKKIVDNFVLTDSTQDAVEVFLNGKAGAVSTWDMTNALSKANSHLLFSTSSAEYLVIDGLVFREEFVLEHKQEITSIADCIFATVNDIQNGVQTSKYYQNIRSAVPDYADYSNEDIAGEIEYARFLNCSGNVAAFDVASRLYKDFCKVWQQLGFKTDENYILVSDDIVKSLESNWKGKESQKDNPTVSGDSGDKVDKEALITQYAKILFNGDTADFKTGYEDVDRKLIDEFVQVAKILNKTVIKISGHVNLGKGSSVWDESTKSYKLAPGFTSSDFAYKLSLMRAETVKEYMVSQGIPETRIIIEGVGGDFPIASNDTEEGQANNRSCEISFYQAGGY